MDAIKEFAPVYTIDIKVKRINMQWGSVEVTPCNGSIWQENSLKDVIIAEAEPIHRELKNYLGLDFSINELDDRMHNI